MHSICTVKESRFTLWLNADKNIHFIKKKALNKNYSELISYKKLSGCICLYLPGVEIGGSKDCHV